MSLTKVSYSMINGASVNVLDYGAVGNGSTDDTSAIQAAANAAAGKTLYFPTPTSEYLISAAITLSSNTIVCGNGKGTIIRLSTGDISGFTATSAAYVVVRDLQIKCTVAGTATATAGVKFDGCDQCLVENCFFLGMTSNGVFLNSTSNSTVAKNSFSGMLGSVGDSSDIAIYRNSNNNFISNNDCYGGGFHGIFMQNPDAATPGVCLRNVIADNQVAGQSGYGITIYTATQPYDMGAIVRNNHIRDITGTQLGGTSGAGIYCAQAGGTVITGNQIENCCISTSNFGTLAPGCIGVASVAGTFPITISNNVLNSVRGPCIAAITNEALLIIEGNSCTLNNSVVATNSKSIFLNTTSNAQVSNNSIHHTSTEYYAIEAFASGGYISNGISFRDNTVISNTFGISFQATSGSKFNNAQIIGNYVKGGITTISNIDNAQVVGNYFNSSLVSYNQTDVTNAKVSANTFISTFGGGAGIVFNGTNTGSTVDESNSFQATAGVDNLGTGLIIAQYRNSFPPYSGTWAVGDRVIQSVPVVGDPKGWRCTVAGNPGTWVSEGNL